MIEIPGGHTDPHIPAHTLKHKSMPASGPIGVETLKLSAACLPMQISIRGGFRGAASMAASWVAGPQLIFYPLTSQ